MLTVFYVELGLWLMEMEMGCMAEHVLWFSCAGESFFPPSFFEE
jgi:hypothetical protein